MTEDHAHGARNEVTGCVSGTLTQPQYRDLLLTAGFTGITITSTHRAEAGLHSAIVHATKPATRHT